MRPLRRTWLALLLSFLAVTMAGCAASSGPGASAQEVPTLIESSATPVASATATIDWFPATATPTPLPSQTVQATADPHPDLGPLLLEDDFSQPGSWQTRKTSLGTVAFGKNELSLAIPNVRSSLVSFRSKATLSDFYLEITATPNLCRGTDAYGLLLRASTENDYYRWTLTCDGKMRLERLKGSAVAVVQDWTPRAARPDATRLGVWASGAQMRFLIDNILQFEAHDPVFASGSLGVFARSSGENSLTVSFSDLVVHELQAVK
jgi:hypothetical protein